MRIMTHLAERTNLINADRSQVMRGLALNILTLTMEPVIT